MANQRILLSAIFIFCVKILWGQPNWREVVMPAFLMVTEEINDSIASRRAESEKLRTEMNAIVAATGIDRVMFFGKDDETFKEGLSKKFTQAPSPLQSNMDRDSRIVGIENLHIQLYESDKALLRWLDFQTKLRGHPDMTLHARWASQWNELPPKLRPRSLLECQRWVAGELACDLVNTLDLPNPDQELKKIKGFEPKFDPRPWDTIANLGENWQLPIPAEGILASFPMNGQFAFDRSESIPGVGYIVFPNAVNQKLFELNFEERQFKVRWTSATGIVKYTGVEYRFFPREFFFNLPDVFLPETVYRLELISIPTNIKNPSPAQVDCWNMFRGNTSEAPSISLQGELKITEMYFRTSKYNLRQKLATMQGKVDWQQGAVVYETDEPLDPLEIYGIGRMPAPVRFDIQTSNFFKIKDAINSKMVYYYLTVPRVESLENVPIDQLVIAERDHTLDAPFVRKVSLGNSEGYPNVPESRERDVVLPGGQYLAKAYKTHGVKDSLVTAVPVPFITREHFRKDKSVPFAPTKCTLYIGELQQLLQLAYQQQQQLQRRVEERAQFFYQLEKRRTQREGKTMTSTLAQFQQQEKENLPEDVKTILQAKLPDAFFKDFTFIYNRLFPGTERYSTNLQLKLNE